MKCFIKLYSSKEGEIKKFLSSFLVNDRDFSKEIDEDTLEFKIDYPDPIVMSDMIGSFIDNIDKFNINMWISLDENVLINVTSHNANDIIKYLYERFPY